MSDSYGFVSIMGHSPWGGSELLWAGAVDRLAASGTPVAVRVFRWPAIPEPIHRLRKQGVRVSFDGSNQPRPLWRRAVGKLGMDMVTGRRASFIRWLRREKPRGVVVSCGSLRDDFSTVSALIDEGIPYALVIQAAGPPVWVADCHIETVAGVVRSAEKVFFVSRSNRIDVENNLGLKLPRSEVVWNPVNLPPNAEIPALPWRSGEPLRCCCVARLEVGPKGQDIILQTLALVHWRNRPIRVRFYGNGINAESLKAMAMSLDLKSVEFPGLSSDVASIWAGVHLGILTSRYEGLPLALVESMLLGRPNVTTGCCGNAEVVEDGVTGFVAPYPTVGATNDALERAWNRREELHLMGRAAAEHLRAVMPRDPCAAFAAKLRQLFA